jgi:hypothetical protein
MPNTYSISYVARDYPIPLVAKEDMMALARAIGFYEPDSRILFDSPEESNKHFVLSKDFPKEKLLWFKHFLQKPLIRKPTNKFLIGYFGSRDCNDMLRLLDDSLFTSVSYGLDSDAKALRTHACRYRTSFLEIDRAYQEVQGCLITSNKLLCNQVSEALAYEKKLVFSQISLYPEFLAKIPSDIPEIMKKDQSKMRQDIINKIQSVKLTREGLANG